MGAFESAWSIVKANPNHQAFNRINSQVHPDTEERMNLANNMGSGAHNLGTVDPNALIYALLAADYQRDFARQRLGLGDSEHGPHTGLTSGLDLSARGDYEGPFFDHGFKSKREKPSSEDYGGYGSVSRMPRPRARKQAAPKGSPHRVLEDLEGAEF